MMDVSQVIFTSYCFGEEYLAQQVRLAKSIRKIYPNANIHFRNDTEEVGKPKFQESLYGFKVHMIKECLEMGYKKIIYFDTAICLEVEVDYWFTFTDWLGFLAAEDKQYLNVVTSDKCLKYCNLTRDHVAKWNLVGGSLYIMDFDVLRCREIFKMWSDMEQAGIFGKQDDLSFGRLQAHRMDETCLAIAMRLNGVIGMTHQLIRYAYEHAETKVIKGSDDPIVMKRHFK